MEARAWALRILTSDALEDKLFQPDEITDFNPGNPIIISEPARSYELRLQRRKKEEKLPPLHELNSEEKRAICLHRFAGHELLAVEIMAYALLAFPDAPPSFRKGVVHTLKEEQGHVQLYCNRLAELGATFGSCPLYRHFWTHVSFMRTPLHYISIMSLTLEMANLDFAPAYGKAFLKAQDSASSALMQTILKDEIAHVRFGWTWLKKLKAQGVDDWKAWTDTLSTTLLTPKRAKGPCFQEEMRRQAGVSEEWIQEMGGCAFPQHSK
jgi:uncharacterized ferritin-like protein (DUF455 family)